MTKKKLKKDEVAWNWGNAWGNEGLLHDIEGLREFFEKLKQWELDEWNWRGNDRTFSKIGGTRELCMKLRNERDDNICFSWMDDSYNGRQHSQPKQ